MDILQDANIWLEGQRKDYLSNDINYSRSTLSLSLSATIGESIFQETDSDGVATEVRSKDFVVTRSDFYPTFGNPIEGDLITQVVGEILSTYEVQSYDGRTHYFEDNYKLSIRIHTKFISESVMT